MNIYPHSIGHHLGMDLHDCPTLGTERPIESGMVITIEPGVYIRNYPDCPIKYHGIGIRIEDDILFTDNGINVITENTPKDPEIIESLR